MRARGSAVWCDKSIYNHEYTTIIEQLFPQSKFICLYRDAMDQIASGMKTLKDDPSGVSYGYARFLQADDTEDPLNALAEYWLQVSGNILEFERRNPTKCFRLYYEDLVREDTGLAERLLEFVGVEPDPEIFSKTFSAHHMPGAGDTKILRTNGIHQRSIGSGQRIDAGRINAARLARIRRLEHTLGYHAR